jgi:hypothetical protein
MSAAAKLIRKTAVLAAVSAFALVPATSATASARAASCPDGHLCLFQNTNHTGKLGYYKTGTDDSGRQVPGGALSAWNRTNERWCVWANPNYGGTKQIVRPGAKVQLNPRGNSALPSTTVRCFG